MKHASISTVEDNEALVGQIADQYSERLKKGERPSADEYVRQYPSLESEIRQVLRSVEAMCLLTVDSSAGVADTQPRPEQLGDYRILREIGRGGMGVVYEAEQLSLKRRVALKVLPFASVLDTKRLQRFKNEALVAAQLEHPNIVNVLGTGCDRGVHYYAMRYIDGRTIAELIEEFRRHRSKEPVTQKPVHPASVESDFSDNATNDTAIAAALSTQLSIGTPQFFRSVARLGLQAAQALEHAHQHGVLHRDIKPSNLLVDGGGAVWISDFGLAHIETDASLTLSGEMVGTIRYMSPEQTLAKRVVLDHRSDLYSLGVTLYELLTLRPAFDGQSRQELIRQIAFEEPVAPRRLNSAIPNDLETIVLKCLPKNPAERYSTSQELADDLQRFLSDQPIRAKRPGVVHRLAKWSRRHRAVVTTASVTFLIAVFIAVALLWRERTKTNEAYRGEKHHRQLAEANAKKADEQRRQAEIARERADKLQKQAEKREQAVRSHIDAVYAAQIALADHAAERQEFGRTIQILNAPRPWPEEEDRRGFEWYYLWNRCHAGLRTTFDVKRPICKLALSPDGRTAATDTATGEIVLWDPQSGRVVREIDVKPMMASALAFSPDGRLAIGLMGWNQAIGQIRIINVVDGALLLKVDLPKDYVSALAFTPDGAALAVGTSERLNGSPSTGALTLRNSRDGNLIRTYSTETQGVSDVSFSPDGTLLACCSGARRFTFGSNWFSPSSASVWTVATGKQVQWIKSEGFWPPTTVRFLRDAKTIVLACVNGQLRAYRVSDGTLIHSTREARRTIATLDLSADGKNLVGACDDGTIRQWNTTDFFETVLFWHPSASAAVFAKDGALITAGGTSLRTWDFNSASVHQIGAGYTDRIMGVQFTPDGQTVVTASYDGAVRFWDAKTAKETAKLAASGPASSLLSTVKSKLAEMTGGRLGATFGKRLSCLAMSPDGRWLATGGEYLRLWDTKAQTNWVIDGHATWVMDAAFSPDGKELASTDADGVLMFWDLAARKLTASLQVYPVQPSLGKIDPSGGMFSGGGNYLTGVEYARDGSLAVAGMFGVVRFDRQHRPLAKLAAPTDGHFHLAFRADGKVLATAGGWVRGIGGASGGGTANEAVIWDLETGTATTRFDAYGFTPWSVAYSPDGKTLAVGGNDGRVKLWSIATGQELLTLSAGEHAVTAIAFSPDGQMLAAGTDDEHLHVWSAHRGK